MNLFQKLPCPKCNTYSGWISRVSHEDLYRKDGTLLYRYKERTELLCAKCLNELYLHGEIRDEPPASERLLTGQQTVSRKYKPRKAQ